MLAVRVLAVFWPCFGRALIRYMVGEGARWFNDGANGFGNGPDAAIDHASIVPRYTSGAFYMCTTSDYCARETQFQCL